MSCQILTFWPSLEVYTEQPVVFICHLYSQFETSGSESAQQTLILQVTPEPHSAEADSWTQPQEAEEIQLYLSCSALLPKPNRNCQETFRGKGLINPYSLDFTWQIFSAEFQKISKTDIQKVTSLESCTYTQEQLQAILGSTVLSTHKCHQDSIY